jgi:hypothetical protein
MSEHHSPSRASSNTLSPYLTTPQSASNREDRNIKPKRERHTCCANPKKMCLPIGGWKNARLRSRRKMHLVRPNPFVCSSSSIPTRGRHSSQCMPKCSTLPIHPNPSHPAIRKLQHYRVFLISVAQPSIPSPLLPTGISRFTSSMPFVSFKKA